MISVSHKIQNDTKQPIKTELHEVIEHYKTKDGFSHYRVYEPVSLQKNAVLLTFWKSSKHYQRAISR